MTFTAYVVGQGTFTGSLKVAQISRTPLQPERGQIATTIEMTEEQSCEASSWLATQTPVYL